MFLVRVVLQTKAVLAVPGPFNKRLQTQVFRIFCLSIFSPSLRRKVIFRDLQEKQNEKLYKAMPNVKKEFS